ncbi:hypothetical protein AcV5_000906 [Taiwanofungus camphoratus]|nr:hypothetical protein AcW2_006471 [Antrodia cinnamomea]KAI0939512.1 hypothetical protein AcV5_000906 [Antrodia cinnamomea]
MMISFTFILSPALSFSRSLLVSVRELGDSRTGVRVDPGLRLRLTVTASRCIGRRREAVLPQVEKLQVVIAEDGDDSHRRHPLSGYSRCVCTLYRCMQYSRLPPRKLA